MDLFDADAERNLLPCDGEVRYFGPVLSEAVTERFFQTLLETIQWKPDELVIYGRRILTARAVAWHGDVAFDYAYSGGRKRASPWTEALLELKAVVEQRTGGRFNACLLNLYHHGGEGMAWHSDDEAELGNEPVIASLSLGATRRFAFKHKRQPDLKVSVELESGSLLLMRGATQTYWLHSLPPSKRVSGARINLTFRTIVPSARERVDG